MSFKATCIGGPLDGLVLDVTNPPMPPKSFHGTRCTGPVCRLARMLDDPAQKAQAKQECDEQESHWFDQPILVLKTEKYVRTGTKNNMHVYQTDNTVIGPGQAIYSEPGKVPVTA